MKRRFFNVSTLPRSPARRTTTAGLLLTAITAITLLFTAIACGESAPLSPEHATMEAAVEQTKEWEKARDKAHDGWDEDERIAGEHCEDADDDIHPDFPLAELIKAEVENPETFHAVLGKDGQKESFPALKVYRLDGSDVKKFDIPLSEYDIENIKAGGQITALTQRTDIPSKYSGIWNDRPKHYAKFDFRTEAEGLYQYWTAHVFVDHWTCAVKLLDIVPNT